MKTRTRARTAWIAALAALLVAGSASAAEVMKVRVGNHPTYTRVVFELDATAGYRIEKQQGDAGSELRVTLDASSRRFDLDRKTVMVGKVALDASSTGRSVAHIQLRKTPSRVKEMILANPPRIVFDLVFPESQLAAIRKRAAQKKAAAAKPVAVASKPAKTPAPAPPKAKPAPSSAKPDTLAKQTGPAPVKPQPTAKKTQPPTAKKTQPPTAKAKTTPPTTTRKPAAAPIAKPTAPVAPAPAPVVPAPAPRVEPKQQIAAAKPVAEKKTTPAPPVPVPPKAGASKSATASPAKPGDSKAALAPGAKPTTEPGTRLADQAARPGAAKLPGAGDQLAGKTAQRPSPTKATPPKPTKPTQPKRAATPAPAAPQPGGGVDWVLWGGIAAGVLLLAVIAVLVMRRRSLPNDMDVTAVAEGQSSEGAIPEGGFSMEDSPAESPFEASHETQSFSDVAREAAPEVESRQAGVDIAAGPGLFDEEDPEKENERMDLENSGMEQTASEMPTQLGGAAAGDADVSRLVRELERRMAQMETRLDESTEARERLERQVAAQAEELRVQRAAIARTQRALRSLNRPAEEQATEPAIREPSA